MRKSVVFLLAGALFCLAGVAAAAPAQEIVLYPLGAQVRAEETLPVKNGEVSFLLPSGAEVDSLMIALDKGTVANRRTEQVAVEDTAAVAALRGKVAEARAGAAALEGESASVKARIALWTKGIQPQDGSLSELEKLDAAMPERLKKLYVQAAALEPQLAKAREEAKRLERELADYGASAGGIRVIAQVGDSSGSVRVRYAYGLSGCGWSPVYRFDAEPEAGVVRFAQQAEIRQSTGQDWKDVRLTLASGNPGGVQPDELPLWRMRKIEPQARNGAQSEMVMAAPGMLMKSSAPIAVRETETFAAWELGTRSVPAGKPMLLELAQGEWKATFVRLARPGYGEKAAWLTAELRLPQAVDLPQGEAQYLVEGLPVGSGVFALSGDSKDLFFGQDSRVRVDMKQDVRQSGSKGLVGKRQTRVWKWVLEVANNHTQPVTVRVEDPEPQSADERIDVKLVAKPAPVVKNHVVTWTLNVPALGKSLIDYTVEASAPEDMPFTEGR